MKELISVQSLRILFAVFFTGAGCCGLAAEGRLVVRIVDADGEPTAARAWVDSGGRRWFEPVAPDTATPYRRDRSFSCDGEFSMLLPAGIASVHVEKGKEFIPVAVQVEVPESETVTKTISLQRWIDMPAEGWYSSDMHIHLGFDNPRVLRQLALADDVHLVPSFTYWLRGRGETWQSGWPDASYLEPIVVDSQHIVTRNHIEIERIDRAAVPGGTVGATFLFNLRQPVTAERYGEHFPTDATLSLAAQQHSPGVVLDSDKPSWAESVIGAALGGLDTIQVCHNHYHRTTTGLGGYGMIGPLDVGDSNAAVGDGLFYRTNELYYRLLNCGFRLAVSGGSAIGVMDVPAGYSRVYAQIDGPLDEEKMWRAIKAGRSFATSGPMLRLAADEYSPGDTIEVESGRARSFNVATSVQSIDNLEALQIVHDGHVVASKDLRGEKAAPVLDAELEFKIAPQRSGWVASRALYRAPDGLLRQAHTSPIYLAVDGKPAASARDARYMLRWIDRLVEIAESNSDWFPDEAARQAVLDTYLQAREKYESIIRDAKMHWGDR